MKKIIYLLLGALFTITFNSCEKKAEPLTLVTTTENLSLGISYANDIYYRLSDGLKTEVSRTNWDIAFVISPMEAAILTNGAADVILKAYPTDWTWEGNLDLTTYDDWTELHNSDTTWFEGAFNMNATGHPNYGWCDYDGITHNLNGVSLYIIETRAGSTKKIWIENKMSLAQEYTFRYADLDGSNEHIVTLDCSGKDKNFLYYSLDTNEEVDREPAADQWDLVFTKWIDNEMNYPVTGVLQNTGITAKESTDTDPLSEVFPETGYHTDISTVGADWKTFSMNTMQYVLDDTRVFYLKDKEEKKYRISFKTFEGSSTGNLSFDISTMK